VKVTIKGKTYSSCSTPSCQYFYEVNQTPLMQELFPLGLFPGDNLNIFGIHLLTYIGNGITP
jgi:hypothetical protein